ncbi:hypothetical protein CROQUDRAFT_36036, partial [Cronartium quercuum f. sp. fusiforme G11]
VEKQSMQETRENTFIFFTDGSVIPEKGEGAAATSMGETIAVPIYPSTLISSVETELIGIILAVYLYIKSKRDKPYMSRLAIFSNNQTVIRKIHNPPFDESNQYLVLFVKNLIELNQLESTAINLYWSPSHEKIDLQEKADKAAKEIMKHSLNNGLELYHNLNSIHSKIKEHFNIAWLQLPMSRQHYLMTPVKDIWNSLKKLE